MSDITLDGYVQDGSGGLSLSLTAANGYTIPRSGIGVGARSWVRQNVTSPYVHGKTTVGQVLDEQTAPLLVRVRAASTSQLFSRITTLVNAVEQTVFTLRLEIDGQSVRWLCKTADSAPGDSGVLDEIALMRHEQLVRLSIPRHPIPLAGPF